MIPSTALIFGNRGQNDPLAASIDDRTVSKAKGLGPIAATYNLGDTYVTDQDNVVLESWRDNGKTSGFEIRADRISGSVPTGSALASWLAAGSIGWSLTATGVQTLTCLLVVQIRDAATLVVLTSAQITITAISHG